MKKTGFTLTIILVLLLSFMTGAMLVNLVGANPYPYTNCDYSFVTVSILSPENKTYNTNDVLLTVTAGAYPGVWGVNYSVDGSPFRGIVSDDYFGHGFKDSVWVNNLSKGSHYITVEGVAPDSEGFVTAYSQVYFTITKDLVTPSQSPEPTSTLNPTSTPYPEPTSRPATFPATLVFVASVGIALSTIGLFVHFKKRK